MLVSFSVKPKHTRIPVAAIRFPPILTFVSECLSWLQQA